MEEKDKIVMIKVKAKTREKLKARGRKGDTYNDVISSMFEELEQELES
ncbi:MAG: hypothetical protein U9N01_04475 [Euryarchaeota archaeon]|nr:hypothetical protein [Euryarchaeota archaeon]